ncbi:glycosyl hydrolase [Geopyxis carbonaria]|nr:glycosyl hydrolase [Geopyxis carbonaria]
MKVLALIPLLGLASAAKPYSVQMVDSVLARRTPIGLSDAGAPFITYEHGVLSLALSMVAAVTGNTTYTSYYRNGLSNVLSPSGTLLDYNKTYYTLDDIRIGPALLDLHRSTGEAKWKTAASELRSQIDGQPRNSKGGLWHRSTYPNQMWLDGIYMVQPFFAQWTATYDAANTTAWNDIVLQFRLVEENTRNATTGLLAHGYDESLTAVWAIPPTGVAPEVWGRALGWYAMALVDVLYYFPASHSGRAELIRYFKRVMAAIKAAQSTEGGWWLVMSQPGRTGNYLESSGSAMFVYAALKGVRKGLLKKADYATMVDKGYKKLLTWVVPDVAANGTLNWEGTVQVGSLGGKGDYDYYISVPLRTNDLKGLGPFVFASVEMEKAQGRWR